MTLPARMIAAQIDLASTPANVYGMAEAPFRPGFAQRAADAVAAAMQASHADILYLEGFTGRAKTPGENTWKVYTFRQLLSADFDTWRREFVRAFRPVFARWPTVAYTGAFWEGLQTMPGWIRMQTISIVAGLLHDAGARWWGIDTSGTVTAPSWEADVLSLTDSLDLPPLIEGPAYRGNEHLLRFGSIQTTEQYRQAQDGHLPGMHPLEAHNPTQPRILEWNGGNANSDWSDDFEAEGWKMVQWCHNRGLIPGLAPWGLGDLRRFIVKTTPAGDKE